MTDIIEENAQSAETPEEDVVPAPSAPPHALVIYPNPEKPTRERLGPEPYMPYAGSRILLSAMPNCGKRNLILNIIHRIVPKPSHCHIVHCNTDTNEYDCLANWDIPMTIYEPSDFPTLENIIHPDEEDEADDAASDADGSDGGCAQEEPDEHCCLQSAPRSGPIVIVDECPTDSLGRIGAHRLERLVNHICTHKNTTLMCSIQSMINIPCKARRGFNHIVLWKQADADVNRLSAERAAISNEMLDDLFGLCQSRHDFIWIDLDEQIDSKWRFRLNFIEPIIINRLEAE